MLETAEDDIEEIPHLPGLPNVVRRDDAGMFPNKSVPKRVVLFLDIDPELIALLRRDDGGKEVGVHREQQLELDRDGGRGGIKS